MRRLWLLLAVLLVCAVGMAWGGPVWDTYTLLHMSAQTLDPPSPQQALQENVLEVSVGSDRDAFRLQRNGEIWLRGKLLAADPELGEAMWQTWIAHNEYMMERHRKERAELMAALDRIDAALRGAAK